MICPHVHFRDWNEDTKETILNGLNVAYLSGLDAVFEMPNTMPMLTSIVNIEARLKRGVDAQKILKKKYDDFEIFHGIYAGLTSFEKQIEEMIFAYNHHQQIVGLKIYFGKSTGNLSILEPDEQKFVWKYLVKMGFTGLIAGHCEKQSFIKDNLWEPENSKSHTIVRPPIAEFESVKDQIQYAEEAGFEGTFHICHVSVPDALDYILYKKDKVPFRMTCGLTPHHALLYDDMMVGEKGLYLKMNPPLRSKDMQESMLKSLFEEKIDWIETDHAPHTRQDKISNFASGIPGLPFYPKFIDFLIENGMDESLIQKISHNNILDAFGMDKQFITNSHGKNRNKDYDSLASQYDFDAFSIY
jgi:dihydroorotase